jgi:hypothetical protein
MEVPAFFRVVALKKGKVKPSEFRLREGESGLSLFAFTGQLAAAVIVEAVREAGKQGELAAAVIPRKVFDELGLRLKKTPGGTPDEAVNALHYEARLPLSRCLLAWLRGIRTHDYFNEHLSEKLLQRAKLWDEGAVS